MSKRYPGGYLTASPVVPTSTAAPGVWTLEQQYQANGAGNWPMAAGYQINKSLRFRNSVTAYLSRTPASAGNRQTYTYSAWVKRGQLGARSLLWQGTSGANNYFAFLFDGDNSIRVEDYGSSSNTLYVNTSAVFRDPSAWYHIVLTMDTTNATAANRTILYVNGVKQTLSYTTGPISQNTNTQFNNNTSAIGLGGNTVNSGITYDGEFAEVNFVDGQALTASSFGTTDAYGIWQPIKYSGSYGVNGFYLPFTNTTSTTTLGYDSSGNGNNWTTLNISLTAGTTYDSMNDSPTNNSSTVANYCTLNPLEYSTSFSNIVLSNGNLTLTSVANHGYNNCSATFSPEGFKGYFEVTCTNSPNGHLGVSNAPPNQDNFQTVGTIYLDTGGNVYNAYFNTLVTACTSAFSSGDVMMVAFDFTGGARQIWFGRNGTWGVNSGGSTGVPSTGAFPTVTNATLSAYGPYRFYFALNNGAAAAANFGQQPFTYTAPTGFLPLNTYNLPNSNVPVGNQVMDATTYTGSGSNTTITNAGSFKPDLVWVKTRSVSRDHVLFDSVRGFGSNKELVSNNTGAEGNDSTATYGYVGSAASNGFAVTAGTSGSQYVNENGTTYVGWQWQAGQGNNVSNTNGSITSTVSVNPTAGFSVVTWTGAGSAGTIGHGLGVTPSMIIIKNRTSSQYWFVNQASISATQNLYLNTNDSVQSLDGIFTSRNSSTFGVGTGAASSATNYVAYCWAAVAGFSAFGSYTGNGSTDGPFVYTGFRAKFVMIKRTDNVGDWYMLDTSRDTYNLVTQKLMADLSVAENGNGESTSTNTLDILSNGFKLRSTNTASNTSGGTYIYMAFAENPFKMARAR